MIDRLVATGIDAAIACRVLRVSRSGFYAWKSRPPSERARVDEELTVTIVRIHRDSRTSYGARRVHAELRLGLQIRCGNKRVARLMRLAGIAGISHRRKRVWQSRAELGQAIFEWIEAWYSPRRRHSGIGDVSPLEFENTHHAAIAA